MTVKPERVLMAAIVVCACWATIVIVDVDAKGVVNRGDFVATICTRYEDEERWVVDLESVEAFVDFFVDFGISIDRYQDRLAEIVIY